MRYSIAFSTLLLAGCVASSPPIASVSDLEWAQRVTTTRDDFERKTTYRGADAGPGASSAFLRSIQPDQGAEVLQLYVIAALPKWKFLERAYSEDGVRLEAFAISRTVGSCSRYGCTVHEHVAASVTREMLMAKINSGFTVKFAGSAGDEYISLPGNYIAGFLASVPAKKRDAVQR